MKWINKLLSRAPNPIQEVIDSGVLRKFADFLQRDDGCELQHTTVSILINISAGEREHVKAVVELGVIPHLVRLMDSSHSKIPKAAAWALGNIAWDGPGYRDLVLQAGAVQPLMKLLDQTSDLKSLRRYTWVLTSFCQGDPKPDFNLLRPSLQKLNELIHHSDREVLTDACWALSHLTDGYVEDTQVVFDVIGDAGVCRLVELLARDDMLAQEPALHILTYIAASGNASGNDSQIQLLLDKGVLPCFLTLLSSTKVSIVEHVCWAIAIITKKTRHQMQAVIDSGIIPQLIPMLNHERLYIRKEAAWGISNILSAGSEEQVKFLLEAGCILPLLGSLTMETKAVIVTNVLKGIERVRQAFILCIVLYSCTWYPFLSSNASVCFHIHRF